MSAKKSKSPDGLKRLLLIDGHSMAYRAYHALPPENFANSSGQTTNAIYGFTSMLVNLIRDEAPTHIATAFDVSRKTFRSERFPAYKATRSATPDDFRSQTSYLFQMVEALGINHYAIEGYEADDIIATLAAKATAAGFEVLICSGDRDSFQLVTDQITVLYPKKGMSDLARMTPAAIVEKYGLTPSQYPDFAALRGDPSDNLPSVPGVGEKTATKWIHDFGSLAAMVARIDEIPGKAGESVRSNISSVLLNRELTELRRDVPLDGTLANLEWSGAVAEKLTPLLDLLEIKALKERIKKLPGVQSEEDVRPPSSSSHETAELISHSVTVKELETILDGRREPIALDLEMANGEVSAFAVATGAFEVYTVAGGEFGAWLADESLPKWMHNAKEFARHYRIKGLALDTELAAYLINPGSRNLAIEDLRERFLGDISIADEAEGLFHEFSGAAASFIYQIAPLLQVEIKNREMSSLLVDLEIPTLLELAEMEQTGIKVDRPQLESLSEHFRSEVARETAQAHKAAGKEFNVASPKQLQVILFDELGLPKTKKNKTGYTTDAESLNILYAKTKHPILLNLLRIRETGKLLTTIDGLLAAIASDGRIHTNFQQTVAATGRLSSTDPNLQNIPVRTEEGRRIRACFIAEKPFASLLTADYSQIEMRIMAHLSKDEGLIAAFKSGEDLHKTVASRVFGVKAKDVDAEMRRQIKAMSYGLAYGLSPYGLAQQLDLSPGEASQLMDNYFERFGGIQNYLKAVVVKAREDGYTETILGRRRYLPDLTSDNRAQREVAERMALNAPIQGSAADIIKIAMLKVSQAIKSAKLKSRLLLQVHDELIFEVYPGEETELSALVQENMRSAVELSLPLDVNIGIGENWDHAAH